MQAVRELEEAMVDWAAADGVALREAVWVAADWAAVVDLAGALEGDPQPANATI